MIDEEYIVHLDQQVKTSLISEEQAFKDKLLVRLVIALEKLANK